MAIQVSSIAELQRVMMEETERAMIKTEDDMLDIISRRIDKEVYQAYKPDPNNGYQRTYGLRSSLNTGTNAIDTEHIESYINHDTNYANWYSVKDGAKFDEVPWVVSMGMYGTFNGVGYDGQMHHLNPSGTKWGQSRFYMFMTEKEYMDALSWRLPSDCTVHY